MDDVARAPVHYVVDDEASTSTLVHSAEDDVASTGTLVHSAVDDVASTDVASTGTLVHSAVDDAASIGTLCTEPHLGSDVRSREVGVHGAQHPHVRRRPAPAPAVIPHTRAIHNTHSNRNLTCPPGLLSGCMSI